MSNHSSKLLSEDIEKRLKSIQEDYHATIESLWGVTAGGTLRSVKGQLVERMAKRIITVAWLKKNGRSDKLEFARGRHRIALNPHYLRRLSEDVRNFISANMDDYTYGLGCDVQVMVNDEFVLAVECKAYTENAMLKRILVDSTLLKSTQPQLKFALFQLESMLGGDYSSLNPYLKGSPASHTIMSYFEVDLHIVTLLKGERHIKREIHKRDFYKPLTIESLHNAVYQFEQLL